MILRLGAYIILGIAFWACLDVVHAAKDIPFHFFTPYRLAGVGAWCCGAAVGYIGARA